MGSMLMMDLCLGPFGVVSREIGQEPRLGQHLQLRCPRVGQPPDVGGISVLGRTGP